MKGSLANLWLAPLAPVLLAQGRRVRAAMPPLPEASGPREGRVAGETPCLDVFFLGESTIAGVGVPRMHDALPAAAARELARRTGREVCWCAMAASGATAASAASLLEDAAHRAHASRASLLVLALGVSDAVSFTAPQEFERNMLQLLQAFRERFGPAPALLSGVPRVDRFQAPLPQPLRMALGRRCQSLETALTAAAAKAGNALHWPVFLPPGVSHAPQAFAEDGFHPGKAGYRLWARHLALGAQTLLESAESGIV